MKTAGVVIDAWKLEIFKKHLSEAGFVYTQHTGITRGTLTLKVEYYDIADLKPVIEAAQAECKKSRH